MKTELVNNVANEGIHYLQYYKNLYLTLEKIIKILLIVFTTITLCLFVCHIQ